MENKNLAVKIYTFTYGIGVYITILSIAVLFSVLGIWLLPNVEGIAMLVIGLLFILISLCLLYLKYLNYIILADKTISTKKRTLTWNEVYITMSYYLIHTTIRRHDYYIFFDDHYLSKEEIYSRKVKQNAFYLMVTQKRLNSILEKYNKKIQILDSCDIGHKDLYNRVVEYNALVESKQD